jgi:hypothetical protein
MAEAVTGKLPSPVSANCCTETSGEVFHLLVESPTGAKVTSRKLPETAALILHPPTANVTKLPIAKEGGRKNVPQGKGVIKQPRRKMSDESKPAPAFEDPSDPTPPPTGLNPGQYFTQPGAIRVGLSQDIDQDDSESTFTYPAGPNPEEPSPSPQTGTRQEVLVEASLVHEPQAITATTSNVEESLQPKSTMTLVRAEAVPEPGCYRPRNVLIAVAILLVVVAGGVAGAVVATMG